MVDVNPVHSIAEHAEDQLGFLLDETRHGRRCALVTIVGIVERASRNIGTQMVVVDDGRYVGSVSSGCIDGSVASFALESLKTGEPRRVQLGAGSSYFDLQLPCGGGVDLLILPDPDEVAIRQVVDELRRRHPCALALSDDGVAIDTRESSGFVVEYRPKPKLVLAGRGSELTVFSRLATSSGFDVQAFSPDQTDVDSCVEQGAVAYRLESSSRAPEIDADAWTAIVTLFHDHDWEPAILAASLQTDAFYIGALGSPKTHENRLQTLEHMGIDHRDRINGPIGLVPSMRNATMLAISTLAEIVDVFNRQHPPPDLHSAGPASG